VGSKEERERQERADELVGGEHRGERGLDAQAATALLRCGGLASRGQSLLRGAQGGTKLAGLLERRSRLLRALLRQVDPAQVEMGVSIGWVASDGSLEQADSHLGFALAVDGQGKVRKALRVVGPDREGAKESDLRFLILVGDEEEQADEVQGANVVRLDLEGPLGHPMGRAQVVALEIRVG